MPSGTTENIRAIEYQSESRLWFATDQGSVFYRQPDGSFAQATMFSGGSTGALFRDIAATSDGSVVVAVGDAQGTTPNVWRALDGGHTFARVTLPTVIRRGCGDNSVTGNFGNAWSVFFASNAVVYVTGQNANILKSTDGGGSFAEVNRDAAGNCKVDTSSAPTATMRRGPGTRRTWPAPRTRRSAAPVACWC